MHRTGSQHELLQMKVVWVFFTLASLEQGPHRRLCLVPRDTSDPVSSGLAPLFCKRVTAHCLMPARRYFGRWQCACQAGSRRRDDVPQQQTDT